MKFAGKNYETAVGWTVVPGSSGQLEPREGSLQAVGLVINTISTHKHADDDGMVLSPPDIMLLKGLERAPGEDIPNKDMYSLFAFERDGKKLALITYHALLTSNDRGESGNFSSILENAISLRDLMQKLRNLDIFPFMLNELERYIGVEIKVPVVQDHAEWASWSRTDDKEVIARSALEAQHCPHADHLSRLMIQDHSELYWGLKCDSGISDRDIVKLILETHGYVYWDFLTDITKEWIMKEIIPQ
jgi:hypothetical protein